jgi:hypothetical protein
MRKARKEEVQCLGIGDIILAILGGLVALAKLCVAMAVEEERRRR